MSDQGVNTGSTAASYDTYVIFCVGNCLIREAAFRSYCEVHNIGFKSLVGSYKGQIERSFIMNGKHMPFIKTLIKQEESILELGYMRNFGGGDLRRKATLVFGNGSTAPLGYFTEVGRDRALKEEAWTFDPSTNKYWICVQRE